VGLGKSSLDLRRLGLLEVPGFDWFVLIWFLQRSCQRFDQVAKAAPTPSGAAPTAADFNVANSDTAAVDGTEDVNTVH